MAIAFVQTPTAVVATGVTSTTKAFASNVTAGNCLLAFQSQYDGGGPTINTPTDTLSHTYLAAINQHNNGPADTGIRAYYVLNCSGGANTVTFASGSGTSDITGVCAEFSGIATSSALDQTGSASGSLLAVAVSSIGAIAQADELVLGIMIYDTTNTTITEGSTILREAEVVETSAPIGTEYQIVSSIGVVTATWTLGANRNWIADLFTLKAAGAAANPFFGMAQPMMDTGALMAY